MKTTVNKFDFVRAFDTADRGNNFSRAAREASPFLMVACWLNPSDYWLMPLTNH